MQYSRWDLIRVEEDSHLPQPVGRSSLYAAEEMVDFPGCKCILLADVRLFIYHYSQILLCRAAFNSFIPQFFLIIWIV